MVQTKQMVFYAIPSQTVKTVFHLSMDIYVTIIGPFHVRGLDVSRTHTYIISNIKQKAFLAGARVESKLRHINGE